MEKVKFGIMGCGRIAARFAEALRNSPYGEAYACAARDLTRAEAFAAEHACTKAYGNYEEMLADPAVEAVYIATVNNTHAPYAQMCINAGINEIIYANPYPDELSLGMLDEAGVPYRVFDLG